jgi:hypothetical protein
MSKDIFPQSTPDLAATRKKLAPHIHDAFTAFSDQVFAEGALPTKMKQEFNSPVPVRSPRKIRSVGQNAGDGGATQAKRIATEHGNPRRGMDVDWVISDTLGQSVNGMSATAVTRSMYQCRRHLLRRNLPGRSTEWQTHTLSLHRA